MLPICGWYEVRNGRKKKLWKCGDDHYGTAFVYWCQSEICICLLTREISPFPFFESIFREIFKFKSSKNAKSNTAYYGADCCNILGTNFSFICQNTLVLCFPSIIPTMRMQQQSRVKQTRNFKLHKKTFSKFTTKNVKFYEYSINKRIKMLFQI